MMASALPVNSAVALEALNDKEMGQVSGREGIMVSLDYYYNSVKTDQPFNPASPATTGAGHGLASCTDGGALADTDCRLSWQLANRGGAASNPNAAGSWVDADGNTHAGEWLVWKGGWASLSVNNLLLDGSFLGEGSRQAGSSSGLAIQMIDGSGSALGTPVEGLTEAAYESWFAFNTINPTEPGKDKGSFVDPDGNCLLEECTVAYLKKMPALRTRYPGTSGGYVDADKASVGYNDARFGLHVSGLSAEYDTGGQPGWLLNNGGAFTSLTIADNNGHQAGIAFGGDFYLYGF